MQEATQIERVITPEGNEVVVLKLDDTSLFIPMGKLITVLAAAYTY